MALSEDLYPFSAQAAGARGLRAGLRRVAFYDQIQPSLSWLDSDPLFPSPGRLAGFRNLSGACGVLVILCLDGVVEVLICTQLGVA